MEFLSGADPRAASPVPPLTIVPAAGGGWRIQLNLPLDWTVPVTAALQSSPSLAAGSWTTAASKNPGSPWASGAGGPVPVAGPDGGFLFTPPAGPRQFYRLFFSTP